MSDEQGSPGAAAPRGEAQKAGRRVAVPHWPHGAGYRLAAVGESFYQREIDAIAELAQDRQARVYCCAVLVPESDNAYDPNAVAIHVGGKKVAHLSRPDAAIYRDATAELGLVDGRTTCDAVIEKRTLERPGVVHSIMLALDWLHPPRSDSPASPRHSKPKWMALGEQFVFTWGDHCIMVFNHVEPATAELCIVGREVKAWAKPGGAEVFFYAPGGVGGRGRIGVVEQSMLTAVGVPLEGLAPFVYQAERHMVILATKRSSPDADAA